MNAAASTRWLSKDLAHLYDEARLQGGTIEFDVVIVGSGYGGAMAAAELAGHQDKAGREIRVLVLERGKEYVPGMFPSSAQEVPPHIRVHRSQTGTTTGALDGLFDLRVGPDVCAMVGNGLGGGSLVNAGVMVSPDWDTVQRLPRRLKRALNPDVMNALKVRLGARAGGNDNTITASGNFTKRPAKTEALRSLDRHDSFYEAAITVEMRASAAAEPWSRCERCGDCMTGCNVGAKKSLDTTLLLEAWERGAVLVTGGSVTGLKPVRQSTRALAEETPEQDQGQTSAAQRDGINWELQVEFTDESLRRRHRPLTVRAGTVILAAGTLGTTELLMQSASFRLKFSPRLGQQFSCNGDNVAVVQATDMNTNSVGDAYRSLVGREIGPTITGVLKVEAEPTGPAFLIEDFAVPGALKRVFEELVTTTSQLHRLATRDRDEHHANDSGGEPLAVDPQSMKEVLVVGIVGHDESIGQLNLPPVQRLDDNRAREGRIRIDWPEVRKSRLIEDAFSRLEKLVRESGNPEAVLPSPLWRLFPDSMDFIFKRGRGPVLTVHPLGGCPMGPNRERGVVDDLGRVYDYSSSKGPSARHVNLRVLDGSILPSSLGVNPALTIAAVAQRSARQLARERGWVRAGATRPKLARPRLRSLAQCIPPAPVETRLELVEKLWGPMRHDGAKYVAELTLTYRPVSVALLTNSMGRKLAVVRESSSLRIYCRHTWDEKGVRFIDEGERPQHALVEAPVGGNLKLLQRESSFSLWRVLRAGVAYVINRGLRDAWADFKRIKSEKGWLRRLTALASRAGEVRRFDYDLDVGPLTRGATIALGQAFAVPGKLVGNKRLTYSCRSNPWRQLTELQTTELMGLPRRSLPLLTVDGRFMARQALPLARIVQQENQVHALAELASFVLYFARLILSIHLWSFRAPDTMPLRTRNLLPGPIGAVLPEVTEIELDPPLQGMPVRVRLSRYRPDPAIQRSLPPLVLIHGYSASGSTFTHESIPVPMAKYFRDRGRDIWVLDLRTSPAMDSAVLPWNFEDAALADIPVAIAHILKSSGSKQVDVFAHCIGAVMLSMALLTDVGDGRQMNQINAVEGAGGVQARRYRRELVALKGSIRKIVLSQKGPALVYSDGNVLRGYLMRYLRSLVLPQNYQFRAPQEQSVADQALDRLLSSLPYPDEELAQENPTRPWAKTPWVGFRHRLDALYSRAFTLANLEPATLDALEDLFGPLNLDTVSQAVHFARYNRITNGAGRNCFTTVDRVRRFWPRGGTLSIHGEDNGMVDLQTLSEMSQLMRKAGHENDFTALCIPGHGHQDCLIGRAARDCVFVPVEQFLS